LISCIYDVLRMISYLQALSRETQIHVHFVFAICVPLAGVQGCGEPKTVHLGFGSCAITSQRLCSLGGKILALSGRSSQFQ
jgi:hypothetical protein